MHEEAYRSAGKPSTAAPSCRSLGCNDLRLLSGGLIRHVGVVESVLRGVTLRTEPLRDAVEIKIDHRRREQCQHLADQQAADHGVSERLAKFRASAMAQHQ